MSAQVSDPTPAIRRALCKAARSDRRWFAKHPGEARNRRFIPGEAWPQDVECPFVMVIQVPWNPDARLVVALSFDTEAAWTQFDYDVLAAEGKERETIELIRKRQADVESLAAMIPEELCYSTLLELS